MTLIHSKDISAHSRFTRLRLAVREVLILIKIIKTGPMINDMGYSHNEYRVDKTWPKIVKTWS